MRVLFAVGLLGLPGWAIAKLVRSEQDLKFFEVVSLDRPAKYLGFTSSKLDNVVEVPSSDWWYVRPDGRMTEASYGRLIQEIKDKKYPGLDVSDRWDVSDKTLRPLRDAESLKILRLSNTRVTDEGLSILETLPKLAILALNNQTSNHGLKKVGSLTRLKSLELHRARITDEGLLVLEKLNYLELLDLSESGITDAAAATLVGLQSLKQLDVSGTGMTDHGMAALHALPRLEAFYAGNRLTDRGLTDLGKMRSLHSLDLSGARITAVGLRYLVQLKKLEALALSDTQVGDESMPSIAEIRSLKVLELSGTRVTSAGLDILIQLPKLETLSVSWTHLSGPEIAALREMKRLKKIVLNGRTVDSETLKRIKVFAKKTAPTVAVKPPAETKRDVTSAPLQHPGKTFLLPSQVAHPMSRPPPQKPVQVTLKKMDLPRDMASPTLEASPIAIASESAGKGMMIEVGARSSREPVKVASKLTGLKRLRQIEMDETPGDLALQPGAQPVIRSWDSDPKNSLGEINVQAK